MSSKPSEFLVLKGGRLMTGLSADTAGGINWTVKRNFRRVLDNEVRSEGHDLFVPLHARPDFPTFDGEISLVAECVRPNGQRAVVVGTRTTLWRYFGDDSGKYVEDEYVDADYFEGHPGTWIQIGSGFSADGHRWEAECINGYLVLNNGVDLPVTYRVEHLHVVPIYELREAGIASVGTIANHGGILVCLNLRQLKAGKLEALMKGPTPYGPVDDDLVDHYSWRMIQALPDQPRRFAASIPCKVDPNSNTLTLTYPAESIEPGQDIYIVGAGINGSNLKARVINVSGTSVDVGGLAITEQSQNLQDAITAAAETVRLIESAVTGTGATLEECLSALAKAKEEANESPDDSELQDAVATASKKVDDARASHNLADTELVKAKEELVKAQEAIKEIDTELVIYDAVGTIAGVYRDIEGDSSAILKAKSLRKRLIIYTETSIFVASYTGRVNDPWDVEQIVIPVSKALCYPDTLVLVDGSAHVYAGANAFLSFDIGSQVPVEVPALQVCDDVFFKAARTGLEPIGFDNPLTREVWWCVPDAAGVDKVIRLDYRHGTASTTDIAVNAAAFVKRPGGDERWLVMGLFGGSLVRYGLVNEESVKSGAITGTLSGATFTASSGLFTEAMVGRSIVCANGVVLAITAYTSPTVVTVLGTGTVQGKTFSVEPWIIHRAGQAYTSVLESGMEAFQWPSGDKVWNCYTVLLGSKSTDTPLSVEFRKATNSGKETVAATKTFLTPLLKNTTKLMFAGTYLGDRITVAGMNNPVHIHGRIFDVIPRNTRGFSRRPS